MSRTPPIQYSGPPIDADVTPSVRRHLQLLYQKLGNHTQAFQLLSEKVGVVLPGSGTGTGGISGVQSGGTGSQSFAQNGVLVGNGTSPLTSVPPVRINYELTDNGAGNAPTYQPPLIYDAVTDGMGAFIFGKVSASFTADCVTGRYR